MSNQLTRITRLTHDILKQPYKTSVDERLKRSKFAQFISTLTDDEIKVLIIVMECSDNVSKAIKMYFDGSAFGAIQHYALKKEMEKRGIGKRKMLE
jgi:hypothetical protein